ncbi:MAG TPA: T9SS type A sorting domain-containing protein [Chitinophagales bacterium]|nr:T9SS type A sorting domain-containing protein [Chitinophagales bacterium]
MIQRRLFIICAILLLSCLRTFTNAQVSFQTVLDDSTAGTFYQSVPPLVTSDGGMLIGGTTSNTDSMGNWHNKVGLAKLSANGLLQWSKYYSCSDMAQMFALTLVGNGYIFGGLTSNNTNVSNYHLLLVRLDENGDILWTHRYLQGGIASHIDVMSDGGFTIFSATNPAFGGQEPQMLRTDSLGNILWIKMINDPNVGGNYFPGFVTSDGGMILFPTYNWLVKLDSSATISWMVPTHEFNGHVFIQSVVELNDGSFMLLSHVEIDVNLYDLMLAKISSQGNVLWIKAIANPGQDFGSHLALTSGGDILINATSTYTTTNDHFKEWVLLVDTSGTPLMSHMYAMDTSLHASGRFITEASANRFYATGTVTSVDFTNGRSYAVGGLMSQPETCESWDGPDSVYAIIPDTTILNTPTVSTINFATDDTVVNVESNVLIQTDYCIATSVNEISATENNSLTIYPNPASEYFYLIRTGNENSLQAVIIINSLGQVVKTVNDLHHGEAVDVSKFPDGIYLVNLQQGNLKTTCRLVKLSEE